MRSRARSIAVPGALLGSPPELLLRVTGLRDCAQAVVNVCVASAFFVCVRFVFFSACCVGPKNKRLHANKQAFFVDACTAARARQLPGMHVGTHQEWARQLARKRLPRYVCTRGECRRVCVAHRPIHSSSANKVNTIRTKNADNFAMYYMCSVYDIYASTYNTRMLFMRVHS